MRSVDKHFIVTFRDEDHPTADKKVTIRVNELGESYLGPNFVKLTGIVFHTNQMILEMSDRLSRNRFKDTEAIHILATDIIRVEEIFGNKFKKAN